MSASIFLPLTTYQELSEAEMKQRARSFRDEMLRRRSVRRFSSREIAPEIMQDCLRVAGSAPQ